MGEDKRSVWVWRKGVERQVRVEIFETHGGHDRNYNVIVSKVGIERSSKREVVGVIRDGGVDGAVAASNVLVC